MISNLNEQRERAKEKMAKILDNYYDKFEFISN